jgi:hypothetical protein
MAERRRYTLTNVHGLRLAILAGRVGVLPRSATPAADASMHAGGLPVVTRAPLPQSIAGSVGPTIALELVASRLPPILPLEHVVGVTASLLSAPIPWAAVRRVHFQQGIEREEFLAGLAVIDAGSPTEVPFVVSRRLFSGDWPSLPAGRDDQVELGRRWGAHLDRQGRVSAALLVGAAISGVSGWSDGCLAELRLARGSGGCAEVRALARGLAGIEATRGWAGRDLADAFADPADEYDQRLRDYVLTWFAGQDPFADAPKVAPSDEPEMALDLLMAAQGLPPRECATAIVRAARLADSPRAGALAGLSLGRHLLPREMRPGEVDKRLCEDEIAAAAAALGMNLRRGPKRKSRDQRAAEGTLRLFGPS